jgi:hypothetical protein
MAARRAAKTSQGELANPKVPPRTTTIIMAQKNRLTRLLCVSMFCRALPTLTLDFASAFSL